MDTCKCGNEPPSSIKCGECSLYNIYIRCGIMYMYSGVMYHYRLTINATCQNIKIIMSSVSKKKKKKKENKRKIR